jgi:hypothetical protein
MGRGRGGCRVITPRPLYSRERTHPGSCVPQSRCALSGGQDSLLPATAGIESRTICVRTRITVHRNSGYSNDFFIHCHHYDFSCTVIITTCSYIVIITTCSYTIIITTIHALSSLRLVRTLSSLRLVHTLIITSHRGLG